MANPGGTGSATRVDSSNADKMSTHPCFSSSVVYSWNSWQTKLTLHACADCLTTLSEKKYWRRSVLHRFFYRFHWYPLVTPVFSNTNTFWFDRWRTFNNLEDFDLISTHSSRVNRFNSLSGGGIIISIVKNFEEGSCPRVQQPRGAKRREENNSWHVSWDQSRFR